MTIPVVLSDDLTGAMDTGVQLVKKGYAVNVAIDDRYIIEAAGDCDALIIDTESRNIDPEAAFEKLTVCVEVIRHSGMKLIYKKIDSTLRGNIGKELEAVLQTSDCGMAVLAPALPYNGRTTRGGCHYLNGSLITASDLSRDPFAPVSSAYIPDIISRQSPSKCCVVDLDDIRRGHEHLCSILRGLHQSGCRIAVMDAEEAEDLESIADAVSCCGSGILLCGSAGLLSAMLAGLAVKGTIRPAAAIPIKREGPVLVVSGSPAKATKSQIDASRRHGIEVIRLYGVGDAEVGMTAERVAGILARGTDVVIDGAGEGKDEIARKFVGNRESLLSESNKIRELLSDITAAVIQKVRVSGLMTIGGDTAVSICRKLDARSIRITGEVEPLVPLGYLNGGRMGSVAVVTKAGGFGSGEVVTNVIKCLKGDSSYVL